jgi:transcriptional regulator with XRE-family HTH domain
MKNRRLASHLRTHRRRAGLSQRQVGQLLGYRGDAQVSRHENSEAAPLLASAFGYQIMFRVPLHALFPGIYENVKESIERRLQELEIDLHDRAVKGPQAEAIARTLIWMLDRRERDTEMIDGS